MTPEALQTIENRRNKFDVPELVAEIRRLWAERDAKATAGPKPAKKGAAAPAAGGDAD
jgi:hypothetical protein